MPRAPSILVRFARHHSGVANQSHVSRARVTSAFASRAVGFPSRRSLPRQCCLRFASCAFPSRRVPQALRSSLASLVVATASQARLLRSRVVGARLPRRRPSLASQVATAVLLAFRVSHTSHLGACRHDAACALRLSWLRPDVTLDAVGPRSLRSSSRRRRESLTHLSRSHVVGVHLPCRLPYPTLLLLMWRRWRFVFLVSLRLGAASDAVGLRSAHHLDGVITYRSRVPRTRMLACASRAVAPLSRRSSS